MKQGIGIVCGVVLLAVMGANYHATGVNSGVYLNPIDPTDAIYKKVYQPQPTFVNQFVNCERTLIFQNLAIAKMRSENQEVKTDELIEGFNRINDQMEKVLEMLEIDPNEIGDPNAQE